MVEGAREPWELHAWREEMEKSLRAVLVTDDAVARQATVDLVNVLAAKGHPGFRDPLGSSAQVPARAGKQTLFCCSGDLLFPRA